MKEIRRSTTVFEATKALQFLHCIENAAAKFIRVMNHGHHKSMLCIIIYCLVLGLNCANVSCDLEPHAVNNDFNDDDDLAANPHAPVSIHQFKKVYFCQNDTKPFAILISTYWNDL